MTTDLEYSVGRLNVTRESNNATLSSILEELPSYLIKRERYNDTYPAETSIIYRDSRLIDITFTSYPDGETARMDIRDILRDFRDKSEYVCGTKQILEIRKKTYVLSASQKCNVLILFRSQPAWKATIIGNWLIALADILAKEKIIASPYLLVHALRFIIRNQNRMQPDNYSMMIMRILLKADRIYPILQGSHMMTRSALRALGIKLGESFAELGERLIEEDLLTGDRTIYDIMKATNSNIINIIKILIEFEARGIVSL